MRRPYAPLEVTTRRMKKVRQKGTEAELAVRRALTACGVRYRVNVRTLPGSPDLANQTRRFAIFVHGCFWHRHPECAAATFPKSNQAFWRLKFEANVRRDAAKLNSLKKRGYRVLVIWECQTDVRTLRRLLKPLRGMMV